VKRDKKEREREDVKNGSFFVIRVCHQLGKKLKMVKQAEISLVRAP
jgi:hypothetical protein